MIPGILSLSVSSCQLSVVSCVCVRLSVLQINSVESLVFKLQTWHQTGARSGVRLPPPGPPALAPGGTS
eukprot:scaffold421_cov125-Isochrysis_galbana.AAC.13